MDILSCSLTVGGDIDQDHVVVDSGSIPLFTKGLAKDLEQKVVSNLEAHVASFRGQRMAFIAENLANDGCTTVLLDVSEHSKSDKDN